MPSAEVPQSLSAKVAASERLFTPWPAGSYIMSVDLARHGLTHAGKRKISITLLSHAGPTAGHFHVWDLVRDPKNVRYFNERLNTLGVTPELIAENPSLDLVSLRIIGLTKYRVIFKDTVFNGRPATELSYLERI
jgi:hypothetical protein